MKADWTLHEAVNGTGLDRIYMVYELEPDDGTKNWLHEGLSHECSHVWQRKFTDQLRPFKTKCGIQVATRFDKGNDGLYNLAPVATTCLACLGGTTWASSTE